MLEVVVPAVPEHSAGLGCEIELDAAGGLARDKWRRPPAPLRAERGVSGVTVALADAYTARLLSPSS